MGVVEMIKMDDNLLHYMYTVFVVKYYYGLA